MQTDKINSTFNYCREGDLTKLTRHIVDSMKDNTQFPNPPHALADVEILLGRYSGALSEAGKFDREKIAIKDNVKAELRLILRDLAHYVTQIAKGDRALLISSGFDLNVQRVKRLQAPPKLVVDLEVAGQATTRLKRIPRTRAYVHQYTPDPLTSNSVWISETKTVPEHIFTGMEAGSRFWFRVIVIAKNGEKVYWEPVTRIIQ
jgi:hypothetical protein